MERIDTFSKRLEQHIKGCQEFVCITKELPIEIRSSFVKSLYALRLSI